MNPSQLALLVGIATVANGHGIMIEPRPYNLHEAPLQQVAPLGAELPFPCQGRTEHADNRTTLTAGTTQTVKFWISAVHGGGSCQFSLTYDNPPPADPSQWKTIYTIIGDCPAKAAGNIPTIETDQDGRESGPQCGNSDGEECVRQFEVPIPAGIKNSDSATFAFTWFNKIGNREMYMTCAPVSIVGGSDDQELMDSLPPAAPTETGQPAWAAGMTRCPEANGKIFCYEGNTFGLCNHGWADPLPLNEDQVCANGEITYKYNSSA
ncbi:hypothetical protein KVR01_010034 [Diaporthe batatas]|uniref:uncharacterized protein n=1 Tax=Diaporthe batatas TaxID=748121 RepID=UPI001D04CBA8|nr:uncharacterized protein KVR01_010034 [Diaporthe batatas]KAG8160498.1 hypothetical protein KVR01_010034 [Diaporthe batatas]